MTFNLQRFIDAQEPIYDTALAELRAGKKRTHWMWFIVPQHWGLGRSAMARRFGLASIDEARAYLAHPVLGPRLRECTDAMLAVPAALSAHDILGSPDDLKFQSCMTTFALAAPEDHLFGEALERFFEGRPDERSVSLLSSAAG
jgi:uncharacterized protein (DUF1810 family)